MKAREVRVTNPDLGEIGVKIIQPAKVVAAFGVGVGIGNMATAPITDRIDDRFESGAARGAIKLGAATAVLTAIAIATEKTKTKASSDSKAMLAAASVGSVSRLIMTGIDDLTGRTKEVDYIDAEFVDGVPDDEPAQVEGESMNGTLLATDFFDNKTNSMSGTTNLFNSRSFGAYLES